jgi:hypothetical protein
VDGTTRQREIPLGPDGTSLTATNQELYGYSRCEARQKLFPFAAGDIPEFV